MIGQKLAGRYEIVSEIGRGGMGVVYRGHDSVLDRDVAIKLVSPGLITTDIAERFRIEAKIVARMDYPSIVSIHDFGDHDGAMFFVMPLVEGEGLHKLIRDRSLTLGDIVDVGIAVADALDYSHAREVIHRDIKPENIMAARQRDGSLRVRVMDFGLARRAKVSAMTKTGVLIGTAAYVSPEQVAGQEIDDRADIYSLGTVLYHCITNDVPFTGELQAVLYRIVHENPQSPRALGADIDEELEKLILSCLAKQREDRPRKARDLKMKLTDYRSRLHESERMKSVQISRVSANIERPLSPFVGRTEELAELQRRMNQAIAGECQFVVLSGEPGVGKTRLLDELENLARVRKIRVLHGRFVEQDAAFPYHGFCETIQDYFRRRETDSGSSEPPDFSDIGNDLIALFPMLSEVEAIRASSGEMSLSDQPVESGSPESRNKIFELLARTLTRLAGGRPLLLFLEDLHGAELSLEALLYIFRRLGPTPTLIVGTYRSTEVDRGHRLNQVLENLQGDRRFISLSLNPLSADDHHKFLLTLVGGSEIGGSLAKRLYEASEGNPFFTKELLRSLFDSGGVTQDDRGTWTLSGQREIAADMLPATIQQAVETRIGRLPDEMRAVLAIASVMGKSFDFRDLETLAGDREDLDDAVDRLVNEGLVEEERRSRGDRLTFTSGVVREVLYAGLSRRKRRSLHRRYATELEKRFKGRLERAYPQLVHHFYEGDVPEKTVEYGMLQARKALDAFGAEEACRAARTALEFLDDEWEGERSVEPECRVLLAAGLEINGDVGRALDELETAIGQFDRFGKPRRSVETMLVAARAAWQVRRVDDTWRWVERGMEAARNIEDNETLRQLLTLAATLTGMRGEHAQATRYAQEAERLKPGAGHEPKEARIPSGGTLVAALSHFTASEPAAIQLIEEAEVYSNICETLVATNADGILIPALAESWDTGDGKTFEFRLRTDVRFQDGSPLTAGDVLKSWAGSIRRVVPNLTAAFGAIEGAQELAAGKSETLTGVQALSDDRLAIRLVEPLPIFPALLTDPRSGVTKDAADRLIGSGPFRLVTRTDERLVLESHAEYWKGSAPKLERIEFRLGLNATDIASGLHDGTFDLARDLRPRDLDEILRDRRWRGQVVEVAQKTSYFLLFNALSGPVGSNEALRRALSGVVRTRDLVWRTLGRFAQPATGYLPPGILGHDPGRRPDVISIDQARELLQLSGLEAPIKLRAAVHPLIADRYRQLLENLFALWSDLEVEVEIVTGEIKSFLDAWENNSGIDVWIGRWIPDYNDPDNFTHTLFHSGSGLLRNYFSSEETDELLDQARAEREPSRRERMYHSFERQCLDGGILTPLFQDVDYRVTSPKVRGIRLSNIPPHVNYSELGKSESAAAEPETLREVAGVVRVPMTGRVIGLDPSVAYADEQSEVLPSVYETLTRDVGDVRIVPWLAAEFKDEDGGRRYRFRLRDDVYFHDGRKLTSRDVRYSFERLFLNERSTQRWQYKMIVGASEILEGKSKKLKGFEIVSAEEFVIELERPVSFFPGLLAFVPASIVPEGTGKIGDSWRSGAVGTGPFRVARFDERGLELERNPQYWRSGHPRSQGVHFNFNVAPRQILEGFKAGRYSLASDLFPDDVEALRRDTEFAGGYRETPRLSTYYIAFNIHRGPLQDEALRRRIIEAVDANTLVQQTMSQVAIPAQGLIPPGLLGHDPSRGVAERRTLVPISSSEITLVAAIHPTFNQEYAAFFERFTEALQRAGVRLEPSSETMGDLLASKRQSEVDLALVQWVADYPDADSFVNILQTDAGFIGPLCGSPEIDALIERGRAETDPERRHSTYRRVEELIMQEARLLPLFHEQVYRFARPEVSGLSVSYWSPSVAYDELSVG